MDIATLFARHSALFDKYSAMALNSGYSSDVRDVFASLAESESRIIAALIAKF